LIFAGAIMAILIYLLHLSVAVSKLHYQNRVLSQELVLLREKLERKERTRVQEPIESAGEEPLLAPDGTIAMKYRLFRLNAWFCMERMESALAANAS